MKLTQISLVALTYTYPNAATAALRDINLEIKTGAFALVIGASGSGKSTLLRCLNGLVPHFSGGHISGQILVDGADPVREGPSSMALKVGMVFQDPEAQFVLDRVEDEIAFALENIALPRQEMHTRVEEALRQMHITGLRRRPISSLSGGEQQRVAIAAALVLKPHILVLDEPTSQLDPEAADDVMNALADLNRARGLTIILAEHRIERVLSWANQVILVDDGEIRAGAPAEILEHSRLAPPVVGMGKALQMKPLPCSVPEMRDRLASIQFKLSHEPLRQVPLPDQRKRLHSIDRARLYVRDLRACYGQREVLSGVSLSVQAGELVALMGRNGSGKSTLLKCVVGLVKPTAGQVSVDGANVIGQDTWDICRTVAYLPQNPNALLFADTVSDELTITLANHKMAGLKDIAPLLARLGLTRYAQAYPRDLSVGERERVAVGAVTVTEPGLLLLDEPTRGLDYSSKHALAELLGQWKAEGAGILLVSHDVEFVAGCADRVVMMADGNIVADGQPAEVLTGSEVFVPQIAQLFPGRGWLTVEDAKRGLGL